jgi:CRP-like cAMP-binding protein
MKVQELKTIAVLQGIDDETLSRLAALMERKDYTDGAPVFTEAGPGDSVHFIVNGRVRIEKRAQSADAPPKTLAVLEAGDYFGEMALLDQKPRSASAVVMENATILRLSKAAFDELQRSSSDAVLNLLFAMIRTSGDRIRRLSAHLIVYDEVGKAIGEAQDLAQLLKVILDQLSAACPADWGLVVLRSQFSHHLELRNHLNLELTPEQKEAIAEGRGFFGLALQNPKDQLVDNFAEQEPFKSCQRIGFETPALLLSPIACEAQLLGLIVLGGHSRGQFDLNALNLTRGIARQAAQAILNARHREEEHARSRHARQFVRF